MTPDFRAMVEPARAIARAGLFCSRGGARNADLDQRYADLIVSPDSLTTAGASVPRVIDTLSGLCYNHY